jgi:hypothetical protein
MNGPWIRLRDTNAIERGFDVFVSYATEDKAFVNRLVGALRALGLSVWYDAFELRAGDALGKALATGVRRSRHGVVVLSRNFFKKERVWPKRELRWLLAKDAWRRKPIIFPIWHGVSESEVAAYSARVRARGLAARVALPSGLPPAELAHKIGAVLRGPRFVRCAKVSSETKVILAPRLGLVVLQSPTGSGQGEVLDFAGRTVDLQKERTRFPRGRAARTMSILADREFWLVQVNRRECDGHDIARRRVLNSRVPVQFASGFKGGLPYVPLFVGPCATIGFTDERVIRQTERILLKDQGSRQRRGHR